MSKRKAEDEVKYLEEWTPPIQAMQVPLWVVGLMWVGIFIMTLVLAISKSGVQ